jgi:uncharacterized protein YcbK (DUF882 family)
VKLSDFESLKMLTPADVPRFEQVSRELVDKFDRFLVELRAAGLLTKPIQVLSTFRTIQENEAVGGSDNSMHLVGKAIDFVVPGDVLEWYRIAERVGFSGIGLYVNPSNAWSMHVDMRETGAARWARVDGVYVAIEQAVNRAVEVARGAAVSPIFWGLTVLVILLILSHRK